MRRTCIAVVAAIAMGIGALSGCVAAKDARIAVENAVDPSTVQEFSWGRVECGEGQVCSEVAIARVDVHRGGTVDVTLRNNTLESVAVQIAAETFDDAGRRVDRTGFRDVALPPRQDAVIALAPDLGARDKLVLHLRARS